MKFEMSHADDTCALDVYRVAMTLVERHGADAVLVAARWSDCAVRAGNPARAQAWSCVVDMVVGMIAPPAAPTIACTGGSVEAVAA